MKPTTFKTIVRLSVLGLGIEALYLLGMQIPEFRAWTSQDCTTHQWVNGVITIVFLASMTLACVAVFLHRKHLPVPDKRLKVLTCITAGLSWAFLLLALVRPFVVNGMYFLYLGPWQHLLLLFFVMWTLWHLSRLQPSDQSLSKPLTVLLAIVSIVCVALLALSLISEISYLCTGHGLGRGWGAYPTFSWLRVIVPAILFSGYAVQLYFPCSFLKPIKSKSMKINYTKIWSITWKMLVSITLLGIMMVCGILADAYFHSSNFHRNHPSHDTYSYYTDYSTSYKVERKCGQYIRTIDAKTGNPLTQELEYIYMDCVRDTLTVFSDKADCRGFLNVYTGRVALPAKWEHAWIFSEGLGAVVINNRVGFIDHSGNWVIQPQFCYSAYLADPIFRGGLCTVMDTCGRYGLIDREGHYVLAPEYKGIDYGYRDYRMLIDSEDRYGLADAYGQIIIPCEYDYIQVNRDGIALQREGRRWMVDFDLRTVTHPFLFDSQLFIYVDTDEYDEHGDRISRKLENIGLYRLRDQYGLLDLRTGKPITPALYDDIDYVSDDLFDCRLPYSGGFNHISVNAKGQEVSSH